MLACQRHLFSLPANEHYLNCAYMGPLTLTAQAAGIAGLQRKAVPRHITAQDFYTESETLRARFAQLVNADAEHVALVPAASYGVAIAAHNLPLRRGQNVVMPEEEFPSDVYSWQERCGREGCELRVVPRPEDAQRVGRAWNQRILEAIDADTAVVAVTPVHWTDGLRFDLRAIGERAREVGALFLVDGTQAVGALPFDWTAVQPDLLVCAGYKWLLGPYQSGFAVVGERLLEGRPFEMNWINRRGSEDFAALVDYQEAYQPGARRFDVGERANFINVPMLLASLAQILEWGVDAIQAYCAALGRDLEAALGEAPGYVVGSAEEHSAHLFGVRVPHPEVIPALLEQLAARKVYVSQRGTSVRVSPHLYNTPEDMEALADALKASAR